MIQNMLGELQESDTQILQAIVEHANSQYLHESRVYRKSTFNILRMLSSYKALSHDFKLRKDQIYNWIIYITKQYNPQTMKQWLNAINSLSNNSTQFVSRKTSYNDQSKKRVNTTINQFYRDCESFNYSKINSHHSTTRLGSNWDRPKIKDFQFDSRDKIEVPVSCKMHYISFEPEDKQNINSFNRIDNQPTKTPGQQSFIMNLPNSNGSPFYLSKITYNTKDVTEIDEEDAEWQLMKTRADIFYSINSKMKSFSALMANFQAFEEYQETKRKANLVYKNLAFLRFINNLRVYQFQKTGEKLLMKQMAVLSDLKIKQKSFKILKVFYGLKISVGNNKKFELTKANPVNFQFLISLMMMTLTDNDEFSPAASRVIHETPKSIRHKAKHFQQTQNAEKIELIFEYFSRNFKFSKEQIQNIFQQLNLARIRKCFKILQATQSQKSLKIKIIHQIIQKSAIKNFMKVFTVKHQAAGHILVMKTVNQKQLKQKCFKILLEIAVSKKIYAKREEYINKKNNILRQRKVIQVWKKKLQVKQLNRYTFQTRVSQASEIMKKTMRNKTFAYLLDRFEEALQEQKNAIEARKQSLCSNIFNFLKDRVKHKKIYVKIRQVKSKKMGHKCLDIWKRLSSISKGTHKIEHWFQKMIFSALKEEKTLQCKTQELQYFLLQKREYEFYRQFRISHNMDKAQIQKGASKVVNKVIIPSSFQTFLKYGSFDVEMRKNQQKTANNYESFSQLQKYLKQKRTIYLIGNMKRDNYQSCAFKRKTSIINSIMGAHLSLLNKDDKKCMSEVLFRRSQLSLKKQFIDYTRDNLLLRHKIKNLKQVLENIRKTNAFKNKIYITLQRIKSIQKAENFRKIKNQQQKMAIFSCLKQMRIYSLKKIEMMNQKIRKRLKFDGLYGLAKMVMRKEKRITETRNMLSESRSRTSRSKFILELKRYPGFAGKGKKMALRINFRIFMKKMNKKQNYQSQIKSILGLRKIKVFRSLYDKFEISIQQKSWQQEKTFKLKKLAVQKVNRSIVREILRKKALYMAIKFRAIYLCKLAFNSLMTGSQLEFLSRCKTYKFYEHFSTQYSSI